MSFPQRHPLQGPGADTNYDYTLGLETNGAQASIDRSGSCNDYGRARHRKDRIQRNPGRRRRRGRGGRGGGAAIRDHRGRRSQPACNHRGSETPAHRQDKNACPDRTAKHAAANQAARVEAIQAAVESKRAGWDGSPVSTARIYAELWPLIMNEDWCLSSPSSFSGGHHAQLWDHNKPCSYLGGQDAGGMGYGAPASVGAALAAKNRGSHRHQYSDRWRSQLCAGRAVDCGASQASDADHHAQQSRMASGADVRGIHGWSPRTWNRSRTHRQRPARSVYRLRKMAEATE